LNSQALNEIRKSSKEKFEALEFVWSTQLSNGVEKELKDNGKQQLVKYEEREEYIAAVIQIRLAESVQQLTALKKGLNTVVPNYLLALFSHFDLELCVCGNPEISVDSLRKHAVYRGCSASSQIVKWFWKALDSFSSEQRQMFLRFVWGRSRLPLSDSDWNMPFSINQLKASEDKLPISHTCFFSVDLPMYTSYEQLREKILYAAYNCTAIDVDFNVNASSMALAMDDV